MKGNNELRLNEATLIDAVQEYLDKRMLAHAPKVTSVSYEAGNRYDSAFVVKTTDRADNGDGNGR